MRVTSSDLEKYVSKEGKVCNYVLRIVLTRCICVPCLSGVYWKIECVKYLITCKEITTDQKSDYKRGKDS